MAKFYERLQSAQKETVDINSAYRDEIVDKLKKEFAFGNEFSNEVRFGDTDGIIPASYIRDGAKLPFFILLECKVDSFRNQTDSSSMMSKEMGSVLLQCVRYLQLEREAGNMLPLVIICGSKYDCFVLPTSAVEKYMSKNWSCSASLVADTYRDDLLEIRADSDLIGSILVHDITYNFDMKEIVSAMLRLAKESKLQFEVSEQNISKVFDYFTMHVLKPITEKDVNASGFGYNVDAGLTTVARFQKDLFMELVINNDDCYMHPKKDDVAIFGQYGERKVNKAAFLSLVNTYTFNYTVDEKRLFTSICDRLIEDADRRNRGDFYTPTVWVDEAHKLMEKNLGDSWKEDYVVWDCCCGTKNLTRDYKFGELYCSTLDQGDIDISKKYNPESVAFQYDFLNDDVEMFDELLKKVKDGYVLSENDFVGSALYRKAPGLIRSLLSGKPLAFLINPPYGTANNIKTKSSGENARVGTSKNNLNNLMIESNIGLCSQQLYAQFLFRIILLKELFNLSDCCLGLFSKSAIISSQSFKGFRGIFKNKFGYKCGMLFQASQFADCSGAWGVLFSIWDNKAKEIKDILVHIKENDVGAVKTITEKILWNMDTMVSCSDWVKEPVKKLKTFDAPQLSSALVCKSKGRGKLCKDSLGYYVNVGNSVYKNATDVFIVNSCASTANGCSILPENIDRVVSNYAARKLITGKYADWVNDKDEYMVPNTEHPLYNQWEKDCVVYSLFNTASNQSSLRNIDYNGKYWDIYNEFFYLTREQVKNRVANPMDRDNINSAIEEDLRLHGEKDRFVALKLEEIYDDLSPDARAVLDYARELTLEMYNKKYRDAFNADHPEYHINTWDAGWYQVKGMLKEYKPDELKKFDALYKSFSDRLRPLVYELGFLKK